jgi:hypothetical protein
MNLLWPVSIAAGVALSVVAGLLLLRRHFAGTPSRSAVAVITGLGALFLGAGIGYNRPCFSPGAAPVASTAVDRLLQSLLPGTSLQTRVCDLAAVYPQSGTAGYGEYFVTNISGRPGFNRAALYTDPDDASTDDNLPSRPVAHFSQFSFPSQTADPDTTRAWISAILGFQGDDHCTDAGPAGLQRETWWTIGGNRVELRHPADFSQRADSLGRDGPRSGALIYIGPNGSTGPSGNPPLPRPCPSQRPA